MIEIECIQCGKKFFVQSYRTKEGKYKAKFCSRSCHYKWTSENRIGENNPKWRKVKRICKQCGSEFFAAPFAIKNGWDQFCSKPCWYKWSSENRRGRNNPLWKGGEIDKFCKQCGKVIPLDINHYNDKKFCSHECYAKSLIIPKKEYTCVTCGKKFFKKRHDGDGVNCSRECQRIAKTNQIPRICIQCGKEFTTTPFQIEHGWGKFCNKICHGAWKSEHMRGENNHLWNGGVTFEPYCPKFNPPFKRRVREFFNNLCIVCGMTTQENGRRMNVHHVNYDKMTCCNAVAPLFAPVCNLHHSKTNTHRREWEEFLTNLINEKYGGKCYYTKEEMKAIDAEREAANPKEIPPRLRKKSGVCA